ncbi:MAG: contact-dependent growth inhibition system immunity protein [Candidatus Binatia bacterium]
MFRADPFTAGDYYEGDLLAAVLRAQAAFWREHQIQRRVAF